MASDSLLHQCYVTNKLIDKKNSWWNNAKLACLNEINLDTTPLDPKRLNQILNKLKNIFKDFWHDTIFDDSKSIYGNKLRNYRVFKNTFRREEYLDSLYHFPYRSQLARLRLSSHKLYIETGRQDNTTQRLPPEKRICRFCNHDVCEDEFHFLLICPSYQDQRHNLFENIISFFPIFKDLNLKDKYIWLLANVDTNIIYYVAKYVTSAFALRSQLVTSAT